MEKYDELINEKNYYRLLLSVKSDLRKSIRKNLEESMKLLNYVVVSLVTNNEVDTCFSLITSFLEEFEKSYNKDDNEIFLSYLFKTFLALPEKECNKTALKHKMLKFFENKHIQDISIRRHGFYLHFAKDSIFNNDIADGYRYALKSEDYEMINTYLSCFISTCEDSSEKYYYIARLCLELIMLQNIQLALKIITPYVDISNRCQNNHYIINFAYLLTNALSQNIEFDKFVALFECYRDKFADASFLKYLNRISNIYYGKVLYQENSNQGMNIFSLLNSL
jgi:hypothetical protein